VLVPMRMSVTISGRSPCRLSLAAGSSRPAADDVRLA